MKETGIIFKSEMVRAIIEGRKTQTRRIVKPPRKWKDQFPHCDPYAVSDPYAVWWWNGIHKHIGVRYECPLGKVGDRLWVRETFTLEHQVEHGQKPPFDDGRPMSCNQDGWVQPHYLATDPTPELDYDDGDGEPKCKWKPSIFMPRWASRITLEITDVRVERLTSISDEDCFAEGVTEDGSIAMIDVGGTRTYGVPRAVYQTFWEFISGKGSFYSNPFVWVISFKRIK